jgi:hypothetical protein
MNEGKLMIQVEVNDELIGFEDVIKMILMS